MKRICLIIGMMALCLAMLNTCKKDPKVKIEEFEIVTEAVTARATSAQIVGTYAYSGKIEGVKVFFSDNDAFAHVRSFDAELNGNNAFSVEITGLQVATTYHYYYSIDYGFTNPYKTENKTFTTQSEAPAVLTMDVVAIDSTSMRVLCKVASDGGQQVTERGVCWNKYGNPTLDDDTLRYHSAGLGDFSCQLRNLEYSTTYYVRAYARNMLGVGFGEVLVFHTGTEVTLPQVSTVEISGITFNSAQCLGNVASNGGSPLTEVGACWDSQPEPTIGGYHVAASDNETGDFTVTLGNLLPQTSYYVRCYAVNAQGVAYGETLNFVTMEGLPVVTTSNITDITATSAKGCGTVTDQGASAVTERGVCWSMGHNPTVSDHHASSGMGLGSYTVNMTGLTPNATYYVRAYATNTQGTSYGAEVNFTAMEGLPVVTTSEVTDLTATSAKCGGNVTDQGGSTVTERGVCWSENHNPTVSDSHVTSGTGAGSYSCNMTGLSNGTTYYVRAYAKNTQGTTYGEEKEFTTLASLPTVVTGSINGTTVSGSVTSDGGATVTERGVCWSTSHNPTTDDTHGSSGTGTGNYSVTLTDLNPGTIYYVRAYAVNSAGTAYGEEKSLTTDAVLPAVTTGLVTNIAQTTAQGSGNVTDSGGATVTERGICWSTSHNPTVSGSHTSSGTGTGSFTVNMTGLTAHTTYFVRAYAKNSAGTAYGTEVTFTTSQSISSPTVTTSIVSNITQTTATGGGNVTGDGGATVTERGICWGTSSNPTISGSHANSGTGTGSFTVNMTGLTAGTTYHVRAYAINSQGTSYGNDVAFTTSQNITTPTVTTSQVTNVTQTTATGGGNVTNSGNATVTTRGVCWSTTHNPTTSGSHTAASSGGTGSFTVNMTSLTANTTYYVRAYATNSQGTSYGGEVSFTTSQNVTVPTVTTSTVNNITQTTATGGGNVTGDGGATVTERGICWGTSSNPTISGSHANSGTGTGSFTVNMTGLTAGTTYHVRAYAINSQGTSYGNDVTFTTEQVASYTIAVSANPTAGGTVSGGGSYQQGQSCTVTATAATGYTFQRWTENGNQVSANANYSFTVAGNRTLVAQFQAQSYTITTLANPSSGGSVTGGGSFNYGQNCTLTATAATGYTFLKWTENGNQVSANANYTFAVTGNRTLVAQFQAQCYTITASANPNGGGSVSGSGNYNYGQSCTLVANSASGYTFVRWTEGGNLVSTNESYTFTVTGDRTLVAKFSLSQPPAGAINGLFTINANGDQVYFSQGNLQYQASTNTWSFAENQYDYIGDDNINISPTYSGWIDLFGWGTGNNPTNSSTNNNSYSSFNEWGDNSINNGGNMVGQWRTLSSGSNSGEWYYLFCMRNTTSGIRYAKAMVNGVNGVVLLPDEWNTSYCTLNNVNSSSASYSSNVIDISEWVVLEQHGAVFLPSAGYREPYQIVLDGSYGHYWSSTKYPDGTNNYAFSVSLEPNSIYSGNLLCNRSVGCSVRLVQDY